MQLIKTINLTLAFLLEIGMYVSFGYFGFQCSKNVVLKYGLMMGLPLVVMVLWGLFAAPKASYRLESSHRVLFELALLGFSFFLLHKAGHSTWAIISIAVALVSKFTAFILRQ